MSFNDVAIHFMGTKYSSINVYPPVFEPLCWSLNYSIGFMELDLGGSRAAKATNRRLLMALKPRSR